MKSTKPNMRDLYEYCRNAQIDNNGMHSPTGLPDDFKIWIEDKILEVKLGSFHYPTGMFSPYLIVLFGLLESGTIRLCLVDEETFVPDYDNPIDVSPATPIWDLLDYIPNASDNIRRLRGMLLDILVPYSHENPYQMTHTEDSDFAKTHAGKLAERKALFASQ